MVYMLADKMNMQKKEMRYSVLLYLHHEREQHPPCYTYVQFSKLCKLQFITNGAFIHWSMSSESDLATKNGFGLFIKDLSPYQKDGL